MNENIVATVNDVSNAVAVDVANATSNAVSAVKHSPAPRLLTEKEAADTIGVSQFTLRYWRLSGKPCPPHCKLGRGVRYPERGVVEWLTKIEEETLKKHGA